MGVIKTNNLLKGQGKKAVRQAEGAVDLMEALRGTEVSPEDIEEFLRLASPERFYDTDVQAGYLGDSAVAGTFADEADIAAQRLALGQLQQYATGEQTEGDRAALALQRMHQAEQARGQRMALQNRMAAQGLGGSGAELAGQLSQMQGQMGAHAMQNAMLDQERSRRALAAAQAAGGMATGMRDQGFNEAATRASALDAFNMSDTDWRRHTIGANKDMENQYRRFMAEGMANQANTEFDQLYGVASGEAEARLGLSQAHRARADQAWKQREKQMKGAFGGPFNL